MGAAVVTIASQPPLTPLRFDGADYERERDDQRLTVQYRRIFALMRDGEWRTLAEIEAATGDPQASISAQLRHMRKPRFGSHIVEKHYISDGLYEYRLIVNAAPPEASTTAAAGVSTREG